MELKDVFGEIEADGAHLVHGRLLEWALTPPLWHAEAVGGVHTIRHGRASDRRLERITGSKRRARSAREKAAIVAEAFAPGANVSEIARRHGLHRGLLVTWRRQVRRARPGPVAEGASERGGECQPSCRLRSKAQ